MSTEKMLPMEQVTAAVTGLGFERVQTIPGSTYKDNSTVVIIPTRGMIHHRVVTALNSLMAPMNQKRAMLFAVGHEVGHAYNAMIEYILKDPVLSKWKYVLCLEDDNIPPVDAHIRLLESIEFGKFDAVGGLYWTKGEHFNAGMCYGTPDRYVSTGELEFYPRDVREAVKNGSLVPCNGLAQGCTLFRMDLFREVPAPWFVTVADVIDGVPTGATQDLHFARRATLAGKRFAVDTRVLVGHLDIESNTVY
jgi:hypothetical protein